MIPVILSGGSGTRLWPLSRASCPKQFLPLAGDLTMLQMTMERLSGYAGIHEPLVVCNEEHRFLVAEQLREAGVQPKRVLLEPAGRNTAPAIAAAALVAGKYDPEAVMVVLPADHLISDRASFLTALEKAERAAKAGALVTFGVVPTVAETGYGYIKRGKPLGNEVAKDAYRVESFVEKPDAQTARTYLESGEYLWNSGMFVFRADRFLEEMERFAPDILNACRDAISGASEDLDFCRLERAAFLRSPSDSVDYAIMERTEAAAVVPLDAGWSDIGSWSALQDVSDADTDGNVLLGDAIAVDTRGTYVRAEDRLVAAVGLEDHVIIETADAVLVARRDRVQDVKKVVEKLKEAGRDEAAFHRRMYRPWGFYEGVSRSDRFQVKRITVKPGASLSLQMHHHRAEHWVVVRGTAKVVCGEKELLYTEDQSTYIPVGTVHRLENPGVIPLELIEVQTGSYLGEDDIVRFEDCYGRN